MLAPYRVGDAGAGRAFARPYREVAGRLRRWEAAGRVLHDPEPAVYLHEYTSGGITVRGLVGALDMSRRATDLAERAVLPPRGDPSAPGPRPGRPHARDAAQPGADPARAPRAGGGALRGARPPGDRARSSVRRPGGATPPDVGDPGRPVGDRHPCLGRQPPVDRRRAPPLRGLPPASAGAPRDRRGTAAWPCSSTRTTPRCSSAPSTGCCAACRWPTSATWSPVVRTPWRRARAPRRSTRSGRTPWP